MADKSEKAAILPQRDEQKSRQKFLRSEVIQCSSLLTLPGNGIDGRQVYTV